MNFDLLLLGAFLTLFCLFTATFLLQRARWRRKRASNPHHQGFYPTAAALSLAILSLQTLAQPDLHHAREQRQLEAEDEDENGDPDDPAARLNRQLKRIRDGQSIDNLKVRLGGKTDD